MVDGTFGMERGIFSVARGIFFCCYGEGDFFCCYRNIKGILWELFGWLGARYLMEAPAHVHTTCVVV